MMRDPTGPGPTVRSFEPIEPADARLLILGTMPGIASLEAQGYYAHPRNAFWPIMLAVFPPRQQGQPDSRRPAGHFAAPDWRSTAGVPYAQRVNRLKAQGIAVWDVLAHCQRRGSLDSAIIKASAVPNDVAGLLARHPQLEHILFNGATAARLFDQHLAAAIQQLCQREERQLETHNLPSTSPAMARLDLHAKHRMWHKALVSTG